MSKSKYLTDSTSRWLVGSSSNSTLHGVRQNAASATRAFSPPESVPISRSAFSPVKPNAPITARQRSSETPDSRSRTRRGEEARVGLYTILECQYQYCILNCKTGGFMGNHILPNIDCKVQRKGNTEGV